MKYFAALGIACSLIGAMYYFSEQTIVRARELMENQTPVSDAELATIKLAQNFTNDWYLYAVGIVIVCLIVAALFGIRSRSPK